MFTSKQYNCRKNCKKNWRYNTKYKRQIYYIQTNTLKGKYINWGIITVKMRFYILKKINNKIFVFFLMQYKLFLNKEYNKKQIKISCKTELFKRFGEKVWEK